jgi:recombination protein RecA
MSDIAKVLKKKYGDMYFGDKPPSLHRVSTEYIGLDYILGGGLPIGRLVQLAAPPSVGKSTTSLCLARTFISKDLPVAYIDLERTCDRKRIEFLGVAQKEDLFHYCRPSDGETAIEFAVEVAALGAKLVIIDSVPNLLPKTVMDSEVGKQSYSPVAKLLSSEYSKLVACFESAQSCLLLINQVRDNVGSLFGGKTNPGGYAIKHALSINIDMFRTGASKSSTDNYTVTYKTLKNKTYDENLSTEIQYSRTSNFGLCPYSSLIYEGIRSGIIVQAGAYYKINEEYSEILEVKNNTLGQGKDNAIKNLEENQSLYSRIYSKIYDSYNFDS